ncbi:MAG: primosomal protein N' [Duncaniella sp.]|nr:primosomal protein N' [Duncaniella sp.]
MTFAEVLLPVPIQGTFTYSVPPAMAGGAKVGHRVVVPFGRKKFYTGIVVALTPFPPKGYEVKDIAFTLDQEPMVKHPQVKLWNWIADYYLCTPGDVYKAAVPAGLRLESETFIELHPDYDPALAPALTEREEVALDKIVGAAKKLTLDQLRSATGFQSIASVVNGLIAKGAVTIAERVIEKYRPHRESYVALTATKNDKEALHAAFDAVKGAPRQEKALLALIDLSEILRRDREEVREVSRAELLDRSGVTVPILQAMARKGIINLYIKELNRFRYTGLPVAPLPVLSEAQTAARDAILSSMIINPVTLLHGVTSSGKTEIYIHLIDLMLRQGKQALYLVPEIALTTQLTSRLQRVFGDKVVIYHSRFTDNERVDVWKRLLHSHEPVVVLGPRSAIFLPFSSLGMVIVDEEHESSYKQQDPAPRYNGRDAAIVLASMHGAKTLLGSATPSVETYYKALSGRYGLVSLTERYDAVSLPEVEIVDMAAQRKKGMVDGILSSRLKELVVNAVDDRRQAILFLNRRGYAPVARCRMCGYVPRCASCDVSLTYHRRIDKLVCHYCGTPYDVPTVCPACQEPAIEVLGYGTERVEDEVTAAFPEMKISRLDFDTTRNKNGYEDIIENFSAGKSDILVGTQMVTKGLDFDNVNIVGVMNADTIINFPDFRSNERAFNMLEQVAGRAGRRDSTGRVLVQTYSPAHPLFGFLTAHDYQGFYNMEIKQRQQFGYPPFVRMIYIYLKHREAAQLQKAARVYADRLRSLFGTRVSGPEEPPVARIQSMYIRRVMLKIEPTASIAKVKQLLRDLYVECVNDKTLSGTTLYYDVDPY